MKFHYYLITIALLSKYIPNILRRIFSIPCSGDSNTIHSREARKNVNITWDNAFAVWNKIFNINTRHILYAIGFAILWHKKYASYIQFIYLFLHWFALTIVEWGRGNHLSFSQEKTKTMSINYNFKRLPTIRLSWKLIGNVDQT